MRERLQALFDERVYRDPDGCWIWDGAFQRRTGYGQLEVGTGDRSARMVWLAHRLSFYLATGESPEQVHHKCHVRACVNPNHLEGLTLVEHQKEHHVKAACNNGHPYPESRYIDSKGRGHGCLICMRKRALERARRIREGMR